MVHFLIAINKWCLKQAQAIGPECRKVIEALFAHRVLDNLRAAQGVIGLARKYGPARLEDACQRALAFDNPKYNTVKTILAKGLDQLPEEPCPQPLPPSYTGSGRFQRTQLTLLNLASHKEDTICTPCPN